MKIKRFFAADIRQAMRMVKEELGPDAVIMSNRSVDGGVEIVAARDFDEQAIHRNLKLDDVDAPPSASKTTQLPNLTAEKPAHVLSSARKRGVGEPENPMRRHMDQYLGYAEKVQLGGHSQAQKIADKVKQVAKPVASNVKPEPVSAVASAANQPFMDELRREMREMRALLDSKLSNIAHLGASQDHPVRARLLEVMATAGIGKALSHKIANRLGSHQQFDLALSKAQEMLADLLPVAEDDLLEQGGIVALVGPTGVGKTTTIAKLAAQFMLKHGSRDIALITTDNYRIGAHEQIHIYGKILDIPVRVATDAEELRQHLHSFVGQRLVLIDTAGMSQRDLRLAEQLAALQQTDMSVRSYLVMSATTQYKAAHEIMDAFQSLQPHATILTKLDEAVSKAAVLSAVIERRLPLAYVTDGQQVPEDIYAPQAQTLMAQCLVEEQEQPAYDFNFDSQLALSHA